MFLRSVISIRNSLLALTNSEVRSSTRISSSFRASLKFLMDCLFWEYNIPIKAPNTVKARLQGSIFKEKLLKDIFMIASQDILCSNIHWPKIITKGWMTKKPRKAPAKTYFNEIFDLTFC